MKRAVFLDRDGVINDNTKHVNKPQDLIIYPQAKEGMKKLYEAGYDLFIVTNQGGIELGFITHEDLKKIHDKLVEELKPYCDIKDIMYCPYFHKKSILRKPEPGMILKLAEKYDIDLRNSWMIGDMDTDIIAGINAGCKTVKIGEKNSEADINCKDLNEAAEKIIKKGAKI